jgi:methyl coenzyme M reductase subunit D
MTWFMNLDKLPPGCDLYTVFFASADSDWNKPDEICTEEVDFVNDARLGSNKEDLLTTARAVMHGEGYDLDEQRILGIVDQSIQHWVHLTPMGRSLV